MVVKVFVVDELWLLALWLLKAHEVVEFILVFELAKFVLSGTVARVDSSFLSGRPSSEDLVVW